MNKVYHRPNTFGVEGVDHINISSRSETWLGKLLDPSYFRTVDYPHIGKFASVLNLWHWLRSEPNHDVLRKAHGDKQRKILENHCTNAFVPNFSAIIGQATYDKIKHYPETLEEIRKLAPETLLLSYYVPKNVVLRVCSNYANVIIPAVEVIVAAVREQQEPDFSCLLPKDADTSYAYLGPFLKQRFPAQYQQLILSPDTPV